MGTEVAVQLCYVMFSSEDILKLDKAQWPIHAPGYRTPSGARFYSNRIVHGLEWASYRGPLRIW